MSDENRAPAEPDGALTPANRNPWYILMTLYGEQEGEKIDWELAEKNRRAWNAWSGQALTKEKNEKFAPSEIDVAEFWAWSDLKEEIDERHRAAWDARADGLEYPGRPDPHDPVDLSGTAFCNSVVLEKVVFASVARFDFAQFHAGARFGSAHFYAKARFDFSRFQTIARFDFTQFHADASFVSSQFKSADFNAARFHAHTEFIAAQFRAVAWFPAVQFHAATWFSSARFHDAWFQSAHFHRATWFAATQFCSAASFDAARFNGKSYFTRAQFGVPTSGKHCRANFTDAEFDAPANFREAVFLTHHPVLAGTLLHEETQISVDEQIGANGIYWPRLRRGWPWQPEFWRKAPGEAQDPAEARESCAKLRHNLTKQGQPEDAHFFFRREMRFAGRSAPWPSRPLYWAFGVLSDYGYSVMLPAFWLAAIWLAGVAAFWGDATPDCPGPVEHSAANLFAFLGYLRVYYPDCASSLSAGLKAWSGVQTFLSYLMLFFLGLGLRQRFRLR